MVFWGGLLSETCAHHIDGVRHSDTFPMVWTVHQPELVCKIHASRMLTYHVDHDGTRGCHVNTCYSCI
jgi:hypothetical protein